MKHGLKILILSFAVLAELAQAQDMEVKVVAYADCHPYLLKRLDFFETPNACRKGGQSLTFMVLGRKIADIDKESLRFSKLEIAGKDVRHNRKGEDAFELGPFPKVDGNGEFVIFDVNLKSVSFGYIGSASVDGTLDIITSERLAIKEKAGIDITKDFSLKAGSLTVSNQPGTQSEFIVEGGDRLELFVSGNLDRFIELEVYENGQKLQHPRASWNDKERKITYTKPKGSVIKLKLKSWEGLKRVTVPIKL